MDQPTAAIDDLGGIFESFLENSPALVTVFDQEGRYLLVNHATVQAIGLPKAQIVGQTFADLLPPDTASRFMERVQEMMETGRPLEVDDHMRINGEEKVFHTILFPVHKHQGTPETFGAIATDVTALRRAEDSWRESEERYRTVVESANQVVAMVNQAGVFLLMNSFAARKLGGTPQDFIGKTMSDLFPEPVAKQHMAQIQEVIRQDQGKTVENTTIIKGRTHWYHTSLQPVHDKQGNASAALVIAQDVTERKLAKQELEEALAWYRTIFQGSRDAILISDKHARLVSVNAAACKLIGDSEQALLNQQILDLHPGIDRDAYHAYHQRVMDGQAITREARIPRQDGAQIDIEFSSQRVIIADQPYMHTVIRDVTEHKAAERAQRREAARFRALFDHAPVGIRLLNSQGHPFLSNARFQQMLGYPAKALREMDFVEFTHPDDVEADRALYQELLAGERDSYEIEKRYYHQDGRLIWGQLSVAAVRSETGEIMYIISMVKDITERKHAETERQRLVRTLEEERALLAQRVAERTADLRQANAQLTRAVRAKDEFLATMSHELRTPLNAILGKTETLQEGLFGSLNDKQTDALGTVEQSGRHLLSLINDILDVAKIESGKLTLYPGPVSVPTTCKASLRMVKQMAHDKQIKLFSTLDSDVTTSPIYLDGRRLRQILINLLNNAIKFTPPGGQVGLKVVGDIAAAVIHFTVWDTGIGISEEDMGRLFQPFVQLDSSLSRPYTGTGLGLTLVARLAEMHGGGVTVESTVGQGSRFTVSLPWEKTPRQASPAVPAPPKPSAQAARKKDASPPARPSAAAQDQPLILLVEDNETSIDTVSEYLMAVGYRVAVARDGVAALECAHATPPELILMDIQMPGMDGLEATRRIRADDDLQDVPIIALTALTMPGDRERCIEAGADVYLGKPVRLKQLVNLIETHMNNRQMRQGATQ